jgi:hypothetical protein
MATSAGEVEVTLTLKQGDFNKMLAQSKAQLQQFGDQSSSIISSHAIAITAALTAIVAFAKKSIDAYTSQELATSRLVRALENQGVATQGVINHLNNQADALERLTGVQDDEITAAQAVLVTFGLQGAQLDVTTRAALDLAAATGMDLNGAAMILAKAFEGNTTMLKRYGIEVSKNLDPTQRFAQALQEINTKMGGQAEAQAATFGGQIKILGAAFNNLEEAIGKLLSGPGGAIVKWMTDAIRSMTDMLKASMDNSSGWRLLANIIGTLVIDAFAKLATLLLNVLKLEFDALSKIPMIGSAFKLVSQEIVKATLSLNQNALALKADLDASTRNKDGVVKNQQDTVSATEDATKGIVGSLQDRNLVAIDLFNEELKRREQTAVAEKSFWDGFVVTQKDAWDFAGKMRDDFFTGFGDSLAATIVEGKKFGESMIQVFKQMAEAIISFIIQMIAKLLVLLALESATGVGPAGGRAIGMAMGGWADGGVIGEPSVITGLHSGRQVLAGESGPEMVVPMSGGQGGVRAATSRSIYPGSSSTAT